MFLFDTNIASVCYLWPNYSELAICLKSKFTILYKHSFTQVYRQRVEMTPTKEKSMIPLSLRTLLPSSIIVIFPVYEWKNPEEKFQKNEMKKRETMTKGNRVYHFTE